MEMTERHILYVEDIEINQLIVKSMIKHIGGYSIECADTGEEALTRLSQTNYHIVLMDIFLPDMNGFELYTQYKKLHPNCTVPFIAITADIAPETKEKANAIGLNDFLEKPIDKDELAAVLAKY